MSIDNMEEFLRVEIKKEISKIIDDEANKASDLVKRRVSEIADSIALRLLKHYEIHSMQDRIVIEVKKLVP